MFVVVLVIAIEESGATGRSTKSEIMAETISNSQESHMELNLTVARGYYE